LRQQALRAFPSWQLAKVEMAAMRDTLDVTGRLLEARALEVVYLTQIMSVLLPALATLLLLTPPHHRLQPLALQTLALTVSMAIVDEPIVLADRGRAAQAVMVDMDNHQLQTHRAVVVAQRATQETVAMVNQRPEELRLLAEQVAVAVAALLNIVQVQQ
jgi:hypothetical protein